MATLEVKYFERFDDIPDGEKFSNVLPIFATQNYADYLKDNKNYTTCWFYGIVSDTVQFLIPFAVRKRYFFKDGMFLTSTICTRENIDSEAEKKFLNSVISIIIQKKLCDWIGQPPNWALFKTVPSDSIFCRFGTYRINLTKYDEDQLFQNVNYHHKRLIKKSQKNNVVIKRGYNLLEDCIKVFTEARTQGNHTLPTESEIRKFIEYLVENVNIYVSYTDSVPKSCILYFSNEYCFYTKFIGMISDLNFGENHLLHWRAIIDAKREGTKYFDFIGARISTVPGSKLDGIQKFKKYFGGEFITGFLWKMPINNLKYKLYDILVRLKYLLLLKKFEPDIIDQEKHKKDEDNNL